MIAHRIILPRVFLAIVFCITSMTVFQPKLTMAQSDPFIGEIIMFAGNFAPRGWALCDGQLLQISQYSALFSVLGTTYGGDGRVTFGLPELRGRAPIHAGTGPGLQNRRLGQKGGSTTLTSSQLPNHTHTATIRAYGEEGNSGSPVNSYPAKSMDGRLNFATQGTVTSPSSTLASDSVSVSPTGFSNPTDANMQPYLTVNYIIALVGVYPSRN